MTGKNIARRNTKRRGRGTSIGSHSRENRIVEKKNEDEKRNVYHDDITIRECYRRYE